MSMLIPVMNDNLSLKTLLDQMREQLRIFEALTEEEDNELTDCCEEIHQLHSKLSCAVGFGPTRQTIK